MITDLLKQLKQNENPAFNDENPKNCPTCKFSVLETKEYDSYGGLHFQNDQWNTYYICSLTNSLAYYDYCPLKIKKED
jgi:hypothetical protein